MARIRSGLFSWREQHLGLSDHLKPQLGIEQMLVACGLFPNHLVSLVLALHGRVWETETQELMRAACDACVCVQHGVKIVASAFQTQLSRGVAVCR